VAARLQGKFLPFHDALMALNEAPTPSIIDETATRLGLNMGEYREDLNRPQVTAQIEENIKTAGGIARPTPTILIGSYETTKPIIFNQETNVATLQQAIDEVRPSYGQAENENPS
jgi:protein-disulfide isomerase